MKNARRKSTCTNSTGKIIAQRAGAHFLATLKKEGWLPGIAAALDDSALADYAAGEIPEAMLSDLRDAINKRISHVETGRAKAKPPKPAPAVQLLLPFTSN